MNYAVADFPKFLKLACFTNWLHDEKAQYFTLSNTHFFRRDSVRMVAYTLPFHSPHVSNYPIAPFLTHQETIQGMALLDDQVLGLYDAQNQLLDTVSPERSDLLPHSQQTLSTLHTEGSFSFDTKGLSRRLLFWVGKLRNQSVSVNELEVVLNPHTQTVYLPLLDETCPLAMLVQVPSESVSFSFGLLRDLFLSAHHVSPSVSVHVRAPYYSYFTFGETVSGVLAHKRIAPLST